MKIPVVTLEVINEEGLIGHRQAQGGTNVVCLQIREVETSNHRSMLKDGFEHGGLQVDGPECARPPVSRSTGLLYAIGTVDNLRAVWLRLRDLRCVISCV